MEYFLHSLCHHPHSYSSLV